LVRGLPGGLDLEDLVETGVLEDVLQMAIDADEAQLAGRA
jgi:hypothetical protein